MRLGQRPHTDMSRALSESETLGLDERARGSGPQGQADRQIYHKEQALNDEQRLSMQENQRECKERR